MEKIYMQDSEDFSSSSSSSFSSKSKMFRFSIILSFFVSIFAIVSLIAAGFNQISYAAPSTINMFYAYYGNSNTPITVFASNGNGKIYNVPLFLKDGDGDISSQAASPIFCLEHYADIDSSNMSYNGSTYTLGEVIDDPGISYILNKSRVLGGTGIIPSGIHITTQGTPNNDAIYLVLETYATQTALWVYMYEKYYLSDPTTYARYNLEDKSDSHTNGQGTAESNLEIIKTATTINVGGFALITHDLGLNENLYTYIGDVVEKAKKGASSKGLQINKANNTISKVGDDDFYQTSEITVSANPQDDLTSFDVVVTGISTAIVVDENGNQKSTGYAPGDKFYIRVPVKDISNETGKALIYVTGHFNNIISGSYYTSGNYQKIVAVTGNQGTEDASLMIDFIGSPNTGMSKTQTIFFIGIVVLLCGIGIIYANSKPIDSES